MTTKQLDREGAGRRTAGRPPASSRRIVRFLGDWAPAVPFLLIIGGLLLGASGWLIQASFRNPLSGEWNLDAWRQAFQSGPLYRGAIVNSLVLWSPRPRSARFSGR